VAILDRTAFYPTSGGQPFDTGTLGEARVLDVIDDDARVIHVLDRPVAPGVMLTGEIDAARRLDHMQQHTGQHILSAAFDRLFANRTLSFHLGGELSTIDLAAPMTADQMEGAVDAANQVVWENRAVTVRFADAAEANAMGLRKASLRAGELRLVEVAGFDLSACGGTHVSRTGAIGLIAVTATEKFKGGVRVSFVCGARALRTLRQLRDAVAGSVRVLSVLPSELPVAIQKAQADSKALRKRVADLQTELAGREAQRLFAQADRSDASTIVATVLDGWDAPGLKSVASALLARGPVAVALANGEQPCAIVVGQSQSDGKGAADVVRALTERFGGKGGGTRELAQAGGLRGPASDVIAAAAELLAGEAS